MSEEREQKFHTNDINQIWVVTHHQYGISAHIPQVSFPAVEDAAMKAVFFRLKLDKIH